VSAQKKGPIKCRKKRITQGYLEKTKKRGNFLPTVKQRTWGNLVRRESLVKKRGSRKKEKLTLPNTEQQVQKGVTTSGVVVCFVGGNFKNGLRRGGGRTAGTAYELLGGGVQGGGKKKYDGGTKPKRKKERPRKKRLWEKKNETIRGKRKKEHHPSKKKEVRRETRN